MKAHSILNVRTALKASALSLAVASVTANAQEVGATKKAKAFKDLVSGETANVQLRNYIYDNKDPKSPSDKMTTQVRGNFGLKTFNDVVTTTLTVAVSKDDVATSKVNTRRPELRTDVAAFDSSYYSVSPFVTLYGKKAETYAGDVGLVQVLKVPAIATSYGAWNLSFETEAYGTLLSKAENKAIRNSANTDVSTALNERESSQKEKAGESYTVYARPNITWDANSMVEGLTVGVAAEYENVFTSQMDVDANGDAKTVVDAERNMYSQLILGYKVNESLTLTNTLSAGHSGFWASEGRSDGERLMNLAMLTYTAL